MKSVKYLPLQVIIRHRWQVRVFLEFISQKFCNVIVAYLLLGMSVSWELVVNINFLLKDSQIFFTCGFLFLSSKSVNKQMCASALRR